MARLAADKAETPTARTLVLDVPGWPGHLAGQHVDVRLTAEDGYQAQRSYSIASPPEENLIAITVEQLEDGEVSSYLCGELRQGDEIELRGPIGGYFVWSVDDGGPLLLVGGGSGIVPLMAMLRHHAAVDHQSAMHLVYSARTQAELLYRTELDGLVGGRRAATITLTREAPGWSGPRGRVDAALLADAGWSPAAEPRCYVCGPTPFVETAADALVELGHGPASIKTERFGPTGG